jgi:GAF domain-containing protein
VIEQPTDQSTDQSVDQQAEAPSTPTERVMAALSGVLGSMEDLSGYLDTLVFSVRDNVENCDAVGVTVVLADRARTAAYTTALTLEIDAVQYAVDDGPCLDAYRNRRENLVDLPTAYERWPMFTSAVDTTEVQSLMAAPLVSGNQCFGALNLYGNTRHAFDRADLALVRLAAVRAADALASVLDLEGAREVAAQMEQAMASRAVIEQAKGVLMGRHAIDETQAFEVLRRQSQHRNVKLRTLAAEVVAGVVGRVEHLGEGELPA